MENKKLKRKLNLVNKKMDRLIEKYGLEFLNNSQTRHDINDYFSLYVEAIWLKNKIENCKECGQLLPKYKK